MVYSFESVLAGDGVDWVIEDEDWNPTPAGHLQDQLGLMEQASREAARASACRILAITGAAAAGRDAPAVYVPAQNRVSRDGAELVERALLQDLALRLSLTPATVKNIVHQGEVLQSRLPRVLAAMMRGDIDDYRAGIITDAAIGLTVEQSALFDMRLAEAAGTLTPEKVRTLARTERDEATSATREERHARAKEERRVCVEDDFDGMAWLQLHAPALEVHRAMARITEMARRIAADPAETRTLNQIRADVAADLFTGRGTLSEVGIDVAVTIPVAALTSTDTSTSTSTSTDADNDNDSDCAGVGNRPVILEGYGAIDAETAKAVFANAPSFRRILTDPFTGFARDMDRSTYRPTAAQRAWLRRAYVTCAAPGCSRPARDCDIDHTVDAVFGGPTNIPNLAPLCRNIHRLKHLSFFKVERNSSGTITTITPTGFRKDTDPPPF